jgi:ATP synthase protein I
MKDEYRAVGSWGTLGLEIVLSVMLGFFGGRWLDGRFGTSPWLALLGFFFGCGAAVKSIHRTWKEMQAVTAREEREQGNPAPVYERPKDREAHKDPAGEGSRDAGASPMEAPEDPDEHTH